MIPEESTPPSPDDAQQASQSELTINEKLAAAIQAKLPDRELSPEQVAQSLASLVEVEVRRTVSEFHSGPLPHPEMLSKYELVKPGLAEWMMARADAEQQHRHRLQNESLKLQANALKIEREMREREHAGFTLGQWLAFTISMTAIIGGVFLTAIGQSGYGVAAICTALASLSAAYIANTLAQAFIGKKSTSEFAGIAEDELADDKQP